VFDLIAKQLIRNMYASEEESRTRRRCPACGADVAASLNYWGKAEMLHHPVNGHCDFSGYRITPETWPDFCQRARESRVESTLLIRRFPSEVSNHVAELIKLAIDAF